jgi:YHS domain-containing protein
VPTKPPNQWVLGVHSLAVKWSACEVDHSPLSNAEVKNKSNYTSATLRMPSWQGQLYFFNSNKNKNNDSDEHVYVCALNSKIKPFRAKYVLLD